MVTLTTTQSGGDPATTYAWTGPGVMPSTSVPSQQVNVTATSTFSVTASNVSGSCNTPSVTVPVAPSAPSGCTLTANPSQLPAGGGSVTLTTSCSGSGAPISYAWTGPNVNPSTTTPSQQVNVTATSTFSVTASNTAGSSPPATAIVTVAQAITLSPPTLQAGMVSVPYSQTIIASGGVAPYTFTVSSGALPAGLALNPQTGAISGTPTSPGTSNFTIAVRDVSLGLASHSYSITVNGLITITPSVLPNGTVGAPYSQTITASGGAGAPYTFSLGNGSLPGGLSLNASTGVVAGAPTLSGSSTFTVIATDSQHVTGSQTYTLTVSRAIPAAIQLLSGGNQIGVLGKPLPQDVVLVLKDANGNPLPRGSVIISDLTLSPDPGVQVALGLSPTQPSTAGQFAFTATLAPNGTVGNFKICLAAQAGNCVLVQVKSMQAAIVIPAKQLTTPMAQVAVNTPTIQLNNVRQRLDQLRLQSSPTVAEGLRANYDGRSLPPIGAFALAPLDKDGKPQPQTGGGASADKPDSFEHWGVFINGDVDIGRQTTTDAQTGFKVTSKGITLGADYRFRGNNVLGASLGFLKADTDLDAGAGTQTAKGYSFSLYGSYVPQENAYVDGILNVGHNKYDSNRQTATDSFSSSTNGNQWGLAISAGYAFNRGPLALTPYGRVEYVNAKVNGFTESGNMDDALVIGSQQIKGTTLTLGGQASYSVSTSWAVLLPNARLELQRLAQRSVSDVSARIVNQDITSPSAQIPILGEDRNFGNFAVGVSAVFPRGVNAFFNYQQLFGKDNLSDRHYTLGLRVDL
jgi:outer membrane autotransporter protein